jgi:class 3 adenylate cyclase/tetratricopeptide (TPR) repeat protein
MRTCPSCGEQNPDHARFCLACASPLAEAPPAGEERKVVSVLFVDLVGFTAASEAADPEDVRARLVPYHAMLRREIERFGGTVEKFIGDAVMAVFGAPVAHEDDAERAVRAALRVVEAIPELNEAHPGLNLAVRAAVNTGEVVVNVGARPERGEGIVAGDVVNTAARLQQVAPVGGVVVGETTTRATGHVIEYEPHEPVALKGKAEPVPLWLARGARSRFGVDVDQGTHVPLIGRDRELTLLQQLFERALEEPSVQLITISGEPGVGKTRLVWELQRFVDDRPEIIFWRQGRCLPYGEGITFWALGEIVKAHAGILESDGPDEVAGKLAAAVETAGVPASERDWVSSHLAPLVGAATDGTGGGGERDEAFAAWRAFLEAVAAERPLVLVVEDIHWADPAMLEFVEHLVDWAAEVPLVVVCTARPELYERHRGWGGGKGNSNTVSLGPLPEDDTARLVAALLDQAVLPASTQQALLERAGGNPLYAEEFIRMLVDRGVLQRRGEVWTVDERAEIPVPETIQALIAARVDTLAPDRKSLLHDAAVVGKVFWSGAVASIGGRDERAVPEGLHDLARKELVRPVRRSSVEGQAEYSFWHLLIRDVAYAQIPRAARAEKHRAAAAWIEGMAGDRVADHAELLAFHHEEAIRLSEATGAAATPAEREAAARFLELAADKTEGLDLGRAVAYLERAVRYLPEDPRRRARMLTKLCVLSFGAGRPDDALTAGREAVHLASAAGDHLVQGDAMAWLASALHAKGEGLRSRNLADEAVALLEREPPGPELVHAYAEQIGGLMLLDRNEDVLRLADQAIDLARSVNEENHQVLLLEIRGVSRVKNGDPAGLDDIEAALGLGLDRGFGQVTMVTYINYADCVWFLEGPRRALEIHRAGQEFGFRRGVGFATWSRAETVWMLFDQGRWDELLEHVARVVEEDAGASQITTMVSPFRALVLVRRGQVSEAAAMIDDFLPRARAVVDPQVLAPALLIAAEIRLGQDDRAGATTLLSELEEGTRDQPFWTLLYVADLVRAAVAARHPGHARRFVDEPGAGPARHAHGRMSARATLAEADGALEEAAALYAEAAVAWDAYGGVVERAMANLGAGRTLAALGRHDEAATPLGAARETFSEIGATPLLAEAEALLARGTAVSS